MTDLPLIRKTLAGKRVLIDTNIIIYLIDGTPPYATLARQLFVMIEKGEILAVFSILSIAEVMNGLIRKGDPRTAGEVRTFLLNFPNVECQDISPAVLAKIGNDPRIQWVRLRTVDSLIIASGLVKGVQRILSQDAHFRSAISSELFFSLDS